MVTYNLSSPQVKQALLFLSQAGAGAQEVLLLVSLFLVPPSSSRTLSPYLFASNLQAALSLSLTASDRESKILKSFYEKVTSNKHNVFLIKESYLCQSFNKVCIFQTL